MNDVIVCSDCERAETIGYAAGFAEKVRFIVDNMPDLIDDAMGVVIESDNVEASPVVDQQVAHVVDQTASTSGISNSINNDDLAGIEEALDCEFSCNDEQKAVSPSGCPKLDILMPKMLSLAQGMQVPNLES
jgi:hypothetical protein